jgi:glutamine synthetase
MNPGIDQLTGWLDERRITEVECLVSDLTGIVRGKISPTSKFVQERGMRLPESVLLQTVTGDYVDEDVYYALLDPADIDMFCRPDPNAAFVVPWASEPTAQVIHDTYDKQGRPIELSPRNVLKRVLALYAERGWQPIVAPEMEFYLTRRCDDPDLPLQPPIGRSGRQETGRQSFSIDAANEFDPLFEDMYDWCEAQGLDLDTLIHEEGTAQMEINFRHGEALHLADQILVFKRTMREAALKHNVAATFMAKPITDEPGSAMHLHQSVIDLRTGENVFSSADGSMSELFLHHVGGLHGKAAGGLAWRIFCFQLPAGVVRVAPILPDFAARGSAGAEMPAGQAERAAAAALRAVPTFTKRSYTHESFRQNATRAIGRPAGRL